MTLNLRDSILPYVNYDRFVSYDANTMHVHVSGPEWGQRRAGGNRYDSTMLGRGPRHFLLLNPHRSFGYV